jgi:hypothetical protein
MSVKPIFVFSLPRSGSTLLQNILGAHPQIMTAPESWTLIPLYYALRSGGVYSEYNHSMACKAAVEFCQQLPGGLSAYFQAIRSFALSLYQAAAGGCPYFLDKTPRYHVIASDIMETFQEGKYIFLFRNPLSILSGIIETWRAVHLFRFDLYEGLQGLITAVQKYGQRAAIIRYEDLVMDPTAVIRELCCYLELDYAEAMILNFWKDPIKSGAFGNPIRQGGSQEVSYREISKDPIEKWTDSLAKSPLRKRFARRYLNWIGPDRLEVLGYEYGQLTTALQEIKVNYQNTLPDLMRLIRGTASTLLETRMWRNKVGAISSGKMIYPHQ